MQILETWWDYLPSVLQSTLATVNGLGLLVAQSFGHFWD